MSVRCAECARLESEKKQARDAGDFSRATDCEVLLKRHLEEEARHKGAVIARATYRFREYTILPDKRPEAPPITFEMECGTCNASSPVTEKAEDGTQWATEHFKANPDHEEYREHITRPYRCEPGEWQ
jgi:hypothetical protein